MPNWCFTNITINHNSYEKIVELEALINSFTQNAVNDSDIHCLGANASDVAGIIG